MLSLISLALVLFVPAQGEVGAQGVNYLVNPSFEEPYIPDIRSDGGGYVAQGWHAWWYNDPGDEYSGPEFKQAQIILDPARVRSGQNAQQYFKPWSKHYGGLYQQAGVPQGVWLTFAIYGHSWSSFCNPTDGGLDCDPRNSQYGLGGNPIYMKVGIDPYGGTDPFSPNIVWSSERVVYDNYQWFAISARSQSGVVTVFTQTVPEWPAPVVNVYWDDASLYQGIVATATPISTPTPDTPPTPQPAAPQPSPVPTQPPAPPPPPSGGAGGDGLTPGGATGNKQML